MSSMPGRRPPPSSDQTLTLKQRLDNIRHLGRLIAQIWRTSRPMTAATIALRIVGALQPIAMLYVGKLIIDEVIRLAGISVPTPPLPAGSKPAR